MKAGYMGVDLWITRVGMIQIFARRMWRRGWRRRLQRGLRHRSRRQSRMGRRSQRRQARRRMRLRRRVWFNLLEVAVQDAVFRAFCYPSFFFFAAQRQPLFLPYFVQNAAATSAVP
jgi:hypothetical protein